MKKILSLIIVVLLLVSCGASKKTTKEDNIKPEPCESITFTDKPYSEIESDYYSVDSLFIDNGCLNIWVTYSGGCGDAEFTFYYNDRVMQSSPPKTNFMLHLRDDDNCRAMVQQKLYYDLSFFNDYRENEGINLRMTGIGKSILFK